MVSSGLVHKPESSRRIGFVVPSKTAPTSWFDGFPPNRTPEDSGGHLADIRRLCRIHATSPGVRTFGYSSLCLSGFAPTGLVAELV